MHTTKTERLCCRVWGRSPLMAKVHTERPPYLSSRARKPQHQNQLWRTLHAWYWPWVDPVTWAKINQTYCCCCYSQFPRKNGSLSISWCPLAKQTGKKDKHGDTPQTTFSGELQNLILCSPEQNRGMPETFVSHAFLLEPNSGFSSPVVSFPQPLVWLLFLRLQADPGFFVFLRTKSVRIYQKKYNLCFLWGLCAADDSSHFSLFPVLTNNHTVTKDVFPLSTFYGCTAYTIRKQVYINNFAVLYSRLCVFIPNMFRPERIKCCFFADICTELSKMKFRKRKLCEPIPVQILCLTNSFLHFSSLEAGSFWNASMSIWRWSGFRSI